MKGNWGNFHAVRENYDRFVMRGTGEVMTGAELVARLRATGRAVEITDRTPQELAPWVLRAEDVA
jgi:hypothetical protein